jgi:hypothetical protein
MKNESVMKEITLYIGSIRSVGSGVSEDDRQQVRFVGEELAEHTCYGTYRGRTSDTRGVTETLYRTDDGRLVVYTEDWSRWRGVSSEYWLCEVSEEDLQPSGQFAHLGARAGYGRPLSLDEALPG